MKSSQHSTVTIEIGTKTIFTVVGVILGLVTLFAIRYVILIVFFSFIVASTLIGPVQRLTAAKVPKWLAVAIVYLTLFALVSIVVFLVSVPFSKETIRFFNNVPNLFESIARFINSLLDRVGLEGSAINLSLLQDSLDTWAAEITKNLGNIVSTGAHGAAGVINIISGLFGGLVTLIAILTMSIYMVYDHDNSISALLKQIPDSSFRKKVHTLIKDIEHHLGRWLLGQSISALSVGIMTFAFLTLLRVQYALPLALFATVMTPIPLFGASLSVIPAILVTLAGGTLVQIIGVPIAYFIIQQLETHFITPRIMSNAVGLPPIIVIVAILIGSQLYGLPGIIIAVPVVAVIHLGLEFWQSSQKDDPEN